MRRTGLVIATVLAVVVLVLYYPQVTDDGDIWWHLRYGATVIQHGDGKPDHSIYSWTPASADWVYVSWLGNH